MHQVAGNYGFGALFDVFANADFLETTNNIPAYQRLFFNFFLRPGRICRPFLSPHFNLTIELPLKTIVRGCSWTVTPITWRNRRSGESKLKIKEMGSRYLFIALYCWLEKYFSRGDYRQDVSVAEEYSASQLPDRAGQASM